MKNNYVCEYGLTHDKPCVNGKSSSNNGFTYSAYRDNLGLPLDVKKIRSTFWDCYEGGYDIKNSVWNINRLPNKKNPPISREEIIAMVHFRFISLIDLCRHNYRYHRPDLKYSFWKGIKALWKIRKEHRNYVWQNKIYEAYPITFKLWWHDQYYVLKYNHLKTSYWQWFYFQLYCLTTILGNNISAKNVLWLQLTDLKSKFWIKFINQKENFMEYFGKEHPFNSVGGPE